MTIGPLLACALGDAYGAGFEFVQSKFIAKHNRMQDYVSHPKFGQDPGRYTDDTQMAIGLCEHMLDETKDGRWNTIPLANRWLGCFRRDPHTGYSRGFYDLLMQAVNEGWAGVQLASRLEPHSAKNGGAMRAFPVGFLADPAEVRDKAMLQASLTHATYDGMRAAAAAALTFHYCYHRVGRRDGLGDFLAKWVPGTDWLGQVDRKEPTGGVPTVQKALRILFVCNSVADAIKMAVAEGGDTDTVAAIVAPCAAVCDEVRNAVPPFMLDKLENGEYGRDYIQKLDERLLAKFPRGAPVAPPKPATPSAPQPKTPKSEPPGKEEGPLDFLFDD